MTEGETWRIWQNTMDLPCVRTKQGANFGVALYTHMFLKVVT